MKSEKSSEMLNRQQRRALGKKPRPGCGHIELPINMRFSEKDETSLMLVPIQAAERLRDGTGDEGDWHTLVMRLNWARLLNKENFNEGESCIAAAQAVAVAIKERAPTEEEFHVLMSALVLCNQMQKMCTRRELRDALREVYEQNEYLNKVQAIKDSLDAKHG